MRLLLFFLLLCTIVQAIEHFPSIMPDDYDNLTIMKEKEFDGNSLWGHINGGADLYLEYGFNRLLFQQVKFKNIEYRIELYRMVDKESAFGIFSILRFNCLLTESLTSHICVTGNQIQAAVGRYYISISNEVENETALSNSFELFNKILSRIDEDSYIIPDRFGELSGRFSNCEIKVVKGILGLQNGFPLWENLFEGYENYSLLIASTEDEKGYANVAEIKFKEEIDTDKFISLFTQESIKAGEAIKTEQNGQFIKVKRESVNKIIYSESDYGIELPGIMD